MRNETEKVVLLTGFSDGIGKATALELARLGYRQWLVGRDSEKSKKAFQEIESGAKGPCEFFPCDLSALREVKDLAARLKSEERLDILINNAGVYTPARRLSADGYELMFAVNHLAPFLLTAELAQLLKRTAGRQGSARIINLSSAAYKNAALDFDDLQHEKSFQAFFGVYSRSKLCNLFFTFELARRLAAASVRANCVHPGIVGTGIGRGYGKIAEFLFRFYGKSAAEGARTTLYLATDPEAEGFSGHYFVDRKIEEPRPHALDREAAARLWSVSESLLAGALGVDSYSARL